MPVQFLRTRPPDTSLEDAGNNSFADTGVDHHDFNSPIYMWPLFFGAGVWITLVLFCAFICWLQSRISASIQHLFGQERPWVAERPSTERQRTPTVSPSFELNEMRSQKSERTADPEAGPSELRSGVPPHGIAEVKVLCSTSTPVRPHPRQSDTCLPPSAASLEEIIYENVRNPSKGTKEYYYDFVKDEWTSEPSDNINTYHPLSSTEELD